MPARRGRCEVVFVGARHASPTPLASHTHDCPGTYRVRRRGQWWGPRDSPPPVQFDNVVRKDDYSVQIPAAGVLPKVRRGQNKRKSCQAKTGVSPTTKSQRRGRQPQGPQHRRASTPLNLPRWRANRRRLRRTRTSAAAERSRAADRAPASRVANRSIAFRQPGVAAR